MTATTQNIEAAATVAEAEQADSYMAWRTAHLAGLISTRETPKETPSDVLRWHMVASFPEDTPGLECPGGEKWYQAKVGGGVVYRRGKGFLAFYYASPALVYKLAKRTWQGYVDWLGESDAARMSLLLGTPQEDLLPIIHIPHLRILEALGFEQMIALAQVGEWLIEGFPDRPQIVQWHVDIATMYGIPYRVMEFVCNSKDVPALRRFGRGVYSFWQHPVTGDLYTLTAPRKWRNVTEAASELQSALAQARATKAAHAIQATTDNNNSISVSDQQSTEAEY